MVVGTVTAVHTQTLQEIHTNGHGVRLVRVILKLGEQLKDQVQRGLLAFILKYHSFVRLMGLGERKRASARFDGEASAPPRGFRGEEVTGFNAPVLARRWG